MDLKLLLTICTKYGTLKASLWTRRFCPFSKSHASPFTHTAKFCKPPNPSGHLHKSQMVSKSKQSVVSEIGLLASEKQIGGSVVRSATHCHKIVSELQVGGSIFEYRLTNFTGYELDGLGIESQWWARFFAPVQTGPGTHPASCTMGTGSFPGVKSGRGVTLTPHPLLVPLVMKE